MFAGETSYDKLINRPKINRIRWIDSRIQNGWGGDASGSGYGI